MFVGMREVHLPGVDVGLCAVVHSRVRRVDGRHNRPAASHSRVHAGHFRLVPQQSRRAVEHVGNAVGVTLHELCVVARERPVDLAAVNVRLRAQVAGNVGTWSGSDILT